MMNSSHVNEYVDLDLLAKQLNFLSTCIDLDNLNTEDSYLYIGITDMLHSLEFNLLEGKTIIFQEST